MPDPSEQSADAAIKRQCRDCRQAFEISPDEIAYLQRVRDDVGGEWFIPSRCTPCRKARRLAKYAVQSDQPDEWRRCEACGVDFQFGGRDRDYFASRGWLPPKRCRDCRQARKYGHENASARARH